MQLRFVQVKALLNNAFKINRESQFCFIYLFHLGGVILRTQVTHVSNTCMT